MFEHSIKSLIDSLAPVKRMLRLSLFVRNLSIIIVTFCLFPILLYSIPMSATLEVTLSDSDSGLLNGRQSVLVEFYNADKSSMIWSHTYPNQLFTNGVTSIMLGPFTNELSLDVDSPIVSLTINGDEVSIPILSSLYSLHANVATKAKQLYDSDALYIYTAPNGDKMVGIGTQTPTEKLELHGNLKFSGNSTGIIFSDGSRLNSATEVGQWMNQYILPGPGNSLIFTENTNLGLGVNQALATLHVSGNIRFNGLPTSSSESSVLTLDSSGNLFTRTLNAGILRGFEHDPLAIGLPQLNALASLHVISLDGTSDIFKLYPNAASTGLVLDSTGKLGLGTNNPNASLHLVSSSTDPLFLAEATNGLGLKLDNNGNLRLGKLSPPQTALFELIPTNNSDDLFSVKDNSGSDLMRIRNDGSSVFSGNLFVSTLNASSVFLSGLGTSTETDIIVVDSSGRLSKRNLPNNVWTNNQLWDSGSGFIYFNGAVAIATDNMASTTGLFVDGEIYSSGGYRFSDDSIQQSGLAIDPNTQFISVGTSNATNNDSMLRVFSTNNAQTVFKALGSGGYGLTISSTGNVSIGGASNVPTALFSVFAPPGPASSIPLFSVDSGSRAFIITANGSIGIGTTDPSSLVTITSTNNALDLLNIQSQSGTSLFHVSSTGNIGINTDNPLAAFHIIHTSTTNNAIQVNDGFSVSSLGFIGLGTTTPTASLHIEYPDSQSHDVVKFIHNTGSADIERFTIKSNGRVGVNTANPIALLSVQGDSTQTEPIFSALSNNSTGLIVSSNGDVSITSTLNISNINVSNLNLETLSLDNSTDFVLVVTNNTIIKKRQIDSAAFGPSYERWTTDNSIVRLNNNFVNMDVAIGTDNSSAKLTVENTTASEAIFKALGTSGTTVFVVSSNADAFFEGELTVSGNILARTNISANTVVVDTIIVTTNLDINGEVEVGEMNVREGYFFNDSPILFSKGSSLFVGTQSTPGSFVSSNAIHNIFVGYQSGQTISNGSKNTAIGYQSGKAITTGLDNTLLGFNSGINITSASSNVLIGSESGFSLTNGSNNLMIGYKSGSLNTLSNNTFIGTAAGQYNLGESNIAIGTFAGTSSTSTQPISGTNNIFIGNQSGLNENGSNKLYIDSNSSISASTPLIYGDFVSRNVGINTTDATHTLTVDGDIKISGAIVFSDNSRLASFPSTHNIFTWNTTGNAIYYSGPSSFSIGAEAPRNNEKLDVVGVLNADSYSVNGQTFISSGATSTSLFVGHNSAGNSSAAVNYTTLVGVESGYNLDTGSNNTYMGYQSGYSVTTGSNNSFYGALSGKNTVNGDNNSFFGFESGFSNTNQTNNSYFGSQSGRNASGSNNSYYGSKSGYSATGSNNSMLGYEAGYSSSSNDSIFVGYQAGYHTTGANNTYIGYESGKSTSSSTGARNTFLGFQTGTVISSGNDNTFLGYSSGSSVTIGSFNTFVGSNSGTTITTGTGNVLIGYNAGSGLNPSSSNVLMIGNGGAPLIEGRFASSGTSNVQINGNLYTTGTSTSSDQRLKKDISPITNSLTKVLKLRPVKFKYRWDEFKKYSFSKGVQIGFIAQEIELLFPELVIENLDGYKGVNYSALSSVLVDSIQTQESHLQELEKSTIELRKLVKEIESKLEDE